MSADMTRAVLWCPEGFRFAYLYQLNYRPRDAKTQPFLPQGNDKTGHSSITITLIKRENKAQHLHKAREVNSSLYQNFRCMFKLGVLDFISKNKLVSKA